MERLAYFKARRICKLIYKNKEELNKELELLSELLCGIANFAWAHTDIEVFKNCSISSFSNCSYSFKLIEQIENEISDISDDAKYEFSKGVFLSKPFENIKALDSETNHITYIWDYQKIVKYVMYQFERIQQTDNILKQISIFKGMLAYY